MARGISAEDAAAGQAGSGGWVPSSPYLPPAALPEANRIIDGSAVGAGRHPEAVRRIYNIAAGSFSGTEKGFLHGPAHVWAEQLGELSLTQGISVYILYLVESDAVVRRFAEEVVPRVRELVAKERSAS
jgi:hypothetical protein